MLQKLKETIKQRPLTFIISFIIFFSLNSLLNGTYLSIPTFFSSYKLGFAIPFAILNFLLIPFLVASTITLTTRRLIELKTISNKKGFWGIVGTFFGILGGACPGCFAGIFPAIIGIFGITANLSILPLKGLEISIISVIFLIIAIYYLSKDMACKIDSHKK